jgi:hypothetical protein
MSEPIAVDLAADPRAVAALARLQQVVPDAQVSQLVRAALLHMAESVPEHEIAIYTHEQMNIDLDG